MSAEVPLQPKITVKDLVPDGLATHAHMADPLLTRMRCLAGGKGLTHRPKISNTCLACPKTLIANPLIYKETSADYSCCSSVLTWCFST